MKLLIMKKPKTELKSVIELDESVTKDTIKRYKVSMFDIYNVLNKLTYVNEDIIDLIRTNLMEMVILREIVLLMYHFTY